MGSARLFEHLIETWDVFLQELECRLLSFSARVQHRIAARQLVDTEKLAALSGAQLLDGFVDIQDIAIPLFHLNLGDDPHH